MILNIEGGIFKTIDTGLIIPKDISVMDDEKIIFLDFTENRLVWINRVEDEILYQILSLPSLNRDLQVKVSHVLSPSTIIIGTEFEIFIFILEIDVLNSQSRFQF